MDVVIIVHVHQLRIQNDDIYKKKKTVECDLIWFLSLYKIYLNLNLIAGMS